MWEGTSVYEGQEYCVQLELKTEIENIVRKISKVNPVLYLLMSVLKIIQSYVIKVEMLQNDIETFNIMIFLF